MKILIGCEESQEVCKAFRAKGHEAYSCDILPCSGGHPEWHIQGDVIDEAYSGKYAMGIFFPPCTFLANSGVWALWHKDGSKNADRWQNMLWGRRLFMDLYNAPIKLKGLENPVSHKYAALPKYSQTIQPYNFGENASKRTCLWLVGLPLLKNTGYYPPEIINGKKIWGNQTPSGQNKLGPSANRAMLRSKTYPGIAKAMADQWGDLDL